MKLFTSLLLLIAMSGCSKTEPAPVAPSLVGTRWSAFSFKSVATGANVYELFRFTTTTNVEVYSATEKTAIIGQIENRAYTYVDPVLTMTVNGKPLVGSASPTLIRIGGKDYTKEP